MKITIEQIRILREERMADRFRMTKAPITVQQRNEAMISVLSEVLEYREAEEASEYGLFAEMPDYRQTSIPLKGTVS